MIELLQAGQSLEELAKGFEPAAQTVLNWPKQAGVDVGTHSDGLTSEGGEKLHLLGREHKQLKVEREVSSKSGGRVRLGERLSSQTGSEVVKRHEAEPPVRTLCRALGLSPSGYCAWLKRSDSSRDVANERLVMEVRRIHAFGRRSYGRLRMHAEIRDEGYPLDHKRLGRRVRLVGIICVTRRKERCTTKRDRDARPTPDPVERTFLAVRSNALRVADIAHIPSASGFLCLAVLFDAWSRTVAGWSMRSHPRIELALKTLDTTVEQRRPEGLTLHADRECQSTCMALGRQCRPAGIRPSMGAVGGAYDKALYESFFATLVCELIDQHRFRNQAEARMAIVGFIESWYNPRQCHSGLGQKSLLNLGRAHAHAA